MTDYSIIDIVALGIILVFGIVGLVLTYLAGKTEP